MHASDFARDVTYLGPWNAINAPVIGGCLQSLCGSVQNKWQLPKTILLCYTGFQLPVITKQLLMATVL